MFKTRNFYKILKLNKYQKQSITTLSPLGSQFNRKPKSTKSIFGYKNNTVGLFGIKELKSPEGFYNLKDDVASSVKSLLNEALSTEKPKRKLVQIFDDISNNLCKVADLSEFVRTSHPNEKYRQAADYTFACISEIVENLNTNLELYNKLREFYKNSDKLNLDLKIDECDKRVTKLYLSDFEQSGIHLDEENRKTFVQINNKLIELLTKFQINSQLPSEIVAQSVDRKFNDIVKHQRDNILIDAMYSNNDNELLREFVYKSYLTKNPIQSDQFDAILYNRQYLSNLCDFKTFSHRANFLSIMETPDNINEFLDLLANKINEKAENDFNKLREFKIQLNNQTNPLMQWDIPYLSSKYKKSKLDLDGTHYRNYLSLGSCMEGLNIIVNSLYKISLEVEETQNGELWCENIYKLRVRHETEGILGYIYCDFYQRANKFSNVDCHYTIQCSKELNDGKYQLPIVVVHLNFYQPENDKPTLLSMGKIFCFEKKESNNYLKFNQEMMENLFHEFGHAMHTMLAKTRYQHVAGTRCSTDFAEVPSQLMEFYCREPKILKLFAKHYETGETLNDDIIYKLCESKKLFSASDLQLQILHSKLDQVFHGSYPLSDTPIKLVEEFTKKYYNLPYADNTYWHLRFSHFVGYGAKYYSYLVSKAIATKIWTECFASDPLSSSMGDKYRFKLLAFGGERKPQELINSLIGFNVNNQSLVNSLAKYL